MQARVGPQWMSHFGWIHLLSGVTLYTIPASLRYLKIGNIKSHKRSMIILYLLVWFDSSRSLHLNSRTLPS